MDQGTPPDMNKAKRKSIPLWTGGFLALFVWAFIPWALSLISPRLGWSGDHPGLWNWMGLLPVLLGLSGLFGGLLSHASKTPGQIDMEPAKDYLLKEGLYRYSRNPMYLSELILMIGWAIFFGSVPVMIAFIIWWAFFHFHQIPSEERILEASFGESYLAYKKEVSRWFGKPPG
jgi:protein-S-isoprenylcysteine O-methyltransferase Ste14